MSSTSNANNNQREFNSRNLLEFSPYKVLYDTTAASGTDEVDVATKNGTVNYGGVCCVKIPAERLSYISFLIRDWGFISMVHLTDENTTEKEEEYNMQEYYKHSNNKNEILLILHKELSEIKLPQEIDNNKNKVAKAKKTTSQLFLDQLRYASLWKFNYEEWYDFIISIQITDVNNNQYTNVLPHSVITFSLPHDEILLLAKLLKKRLWYCKKFDDDEVNKVKQIESRIDNILQNNNNDDGDGDDDENAKYYFIRMSGHSPKDVPRKIKVKNGKETMELLLRSGRILIDLYQYFQLQFKSKYQNILFIPFQNSISNSFEFRCFIRNNKLTAISQYEHQLYYPELQNITLLNQIKTSIIHFFNQIYSHIPFPSYCLDVYILNNNGGDDNNDNNNNNNNNNNNWRCHLIEVNPFYADLSSGACLFDWKVDMDLLYGNSDSTNTNKTIIRIRTSTANSDIQFNDY